MEYIQMVMNQVDTKGLYYFDNSELGGVIFENDCILKGMEEGVYQEGNIEITRLDMQEGIVAGTFEFTLAKDGCDTIRVTDGRFDYRL